MRPFSYFRRLWRDAIAAIVQQPKHRRSRNKPNTTTHLRFEPLEDRVVPTASEFYYTAVSGGSSGTYVIGQPLVVDMEVTQSGGPSATTPTGEVTVKLYSSMYMTTYTIGTDTLEADGTGIGAATLVSTDLPTDAMMDPFTVETFYAGDTNFASCFNTDVGTITIDSLPSGAPPDLAPGTGLGALPIPTGDGVSPAPAMSTTGVTYENGYFTLDRSDLSSTGEFGTPWGQGWSYNNSGDYADGLSGIGGNQTQAPHLYSINNGTTIAVIEGSSALFFDYYNSKFNARFNVDATFTHNSEAEEYILNLDGSTYVFQDFTGGATAASGTLLSVTDPDDAVAATVESWNAAGAPTEVLQTNGSGDTEVYQEFVTTYYSSGADSGYVDTVTQQYKIGSGSWTTISTTTYGYYTSDSFGGSTGDAESAVTTDASGNIISAELYIYSLGSGMADSIDTAGYEQLVATYGADELSSLDLFELAPYISEEIGYNSGEDSGQVDNISALMGGTYSTLVYDYSYSNNSTTSADQLDPNIWAEETTETLPDSNENIVFTNAFGQTMLSVFYNTTTDQEWDTYYRYNAQDQLIMEAQPSAVTGYSSFDNDLVGWSGSSATYLSSSSGLITTYSYGSSTTATSDSAGNVAGYLEATAIQQGTGGSSIPQAAYTYYSNTDDDSNAVYNVASDTVYQETGGDGAETTSYALPTIAARMPCIPSQRPCR